MLGFNQARATFDFIDVGGGKGRVESQIKGEFPPSPAKDDKIG